MCSSRIPIDELVDFPTAYTFRVVAAATDDLADRCRFLAEAALERSLEACHTQPSARGRWCSVRLRVTVHDAREIRRVYAALKKLDGLQMLL